jgi:hypothetical protein
LFTAALSTSAVAQLGGVSHYCPPGQAGSHLSVSGSASFAVNGGSGDLVLHADHIGQNAPGMFIFAGAATQPLPFGNGFRCVSNPVFRTPVITPPQGSNTSSLALDYLTGNPSMITPGSTWYFQFWFRSQGTFDLSDAVQIDFSPPFAVPGWSTIVQGHNSGHPLGETQGGGTILIENQADWATFWSQHESVIPQTPPPAVDFTQDVVVASFAGWISTGGYTHSVTALSLSVATLDVTTHLLTPGPGCAVTAAITNPHHIVRTPRVEHIELGQVVPTFSSYNCP